MTRTEPLHDGATGRRPARRAKAVLISAIGLHLVAETALTPFLPQLFDRLYGIDDPGATGLYLWICRIVGLAALPLWGLAARRWPLHRLVLAGLCGSAVLDLLLGLAPDYAAYTAVSTAVVATNCALLLAYPAFIAEHGDAGTAGAERARLAGICSIVVAFHLSTVVATLVGAGVLALPEPRIGISAFAVLDAVLAVLTYRILDRPGSAAGPAAAGPGSVPGSEPASAPASVPGSEPASELGSEPGSEPGSATGAAPASEIGSVPASETGHETGPEAGSALGTGHASGHGAGHEVEPADVVAAARLASEVGTGTDRRSAASPAGDSTTTPGAEAVNDRVDSADTTASADCAYACAASPEAVEARAAAPADAARARAAAAGEDHARDTVEGPARDAVEGLGRDAVEGPARDAVEGPARTTRRPTRRPSRAGRLAVLAYVALIGIAFDFSVNIARPFFTEFADSLGTTGAGSAVLFFLPSVAALAVLPAARRCHALLGDRLLPLSLAAGAAGLAWQAVASSLTGLAAGRLLFGIGLGLGQVAVELRMFRVTGTAGPAFTGVETARSVGLLAAPLAATAAVSHDLALPLAVAAAVQVGGVALAAKRPGRLNSPPAVAPEHTAPEPLGTAPAPEPRLGAAPAPAADRCPRAHAAATPGRERATPAPAPGQAPVRGAAAHHGPVRHEAVRHEAVRHEAVRHEAVRHEAVRHEAVRHEAV
ncbi:hypothetical protein AB0M26_27845, partial [Streptomyces sp. NPDC051776]